MSVSKQTEKNGLKRASSSFRNPIEADGRINIGTKVKAQRNPKHTSVF